MNAVDQLVSRLVIVAEDGERVLVRDAEVGCTFWIERWVLTRG